MVEFRGFRCDDCNRIMSAEETHHLVCRIDGPVVTGEYKKQLCSDCVQTRLPEDIELKPLRRRAPRSSEVVSDVAVPYPPHDRHAGSQLAT